mmetsp:Transcript_16392/g.40016  ORF Transcript_16392/g.40016 Transcript_16392/m.40016 type:complete len:261 (+) Transcript_16392:404-1186(+)
MKLLSCAVSSAGLFSLLLVGRCSVGKAQQDASAAALDDAIACNKQYGPLVFVLLEDEAVNAAIEDDIRNDLAKIGFEVEARPLSKADLNKARQSGNFHFSITETWGTPYDPMSYASGWIDGKGGEGVYPSMVNFDGPSTREELLGMVEDVLQQEDPRVLTEKWDDIHKYYHNQAVMMPLYGKRIPTLLNNRLRVPGWVSTVRLPGLETQTVRVDDRNDRTRCKDGVVRNGRYPQCARVRTQRVLFEQLDLRRVGVVRCQW